MAEVNNGATAGRVGTPLGMRFQGLGRGKGREKRLGGGGWAAGGLCTDCRLGGEEQGKAKLPLAIRHGDCGSGLGQDPNRNQK